MKTKHLLLSVACLALVSGCKNEPVELPTVKTGSYEAFPLTSVVACFGEVTSDGGASVTERGICYAKGTNAEPTTADVKVSGGSGKGEYTSTFENVARGTYSYRAYAINPAGTAYGETKTFKLVTNDNITMEMGDVTDITANGASFSGKITIGEDAVGTMSQCGFVLGTDFYPTVDGAGNIYMYCDKSNHRDFDTWVGTFTITGVTTSLEPNTTYRIRMYYKVGNTYTYTAPKSFKTLAETKTTVTIAEFKTKPDDPNTWYTLSGIVEKISNSTYGNFYLVDETGMLPIYGLTATKQTTNDQSFSSLGLETGNYITICVPKTTYNGIVEGNCGYFISKGEALSFTTYAVEPSATSLSMSDITSVYPYASSEGSYAYISIFFYTATDQMWLVFFGSGIDETAVLPAGTYTPTTTWGIVNGMQASSGYTPDWVSPSSYKRYYYDNGHFGEYAPYFITGGYVNVTHSGSNAVFDLHLTTHKGSHITGTFTADLKSSLNTAPARGREMIEQHVRNSRKQ